MNDFLTELPHHLTKIRTAFDAADFSAFAAAAHSLRGAAANLGIHQMAVTAKQLEVDAQARRISDLEALFLRLRRDEGRVVKELPHLHAILFPKE